MSERKLRKDTRVRDAFLQADFGELGFVIVGLSIVFTLPWTIFRLARVAWHIESKQGQTDHHKRIVKILSGYVAFWSFGLGLAVLGCWMISYRIR
jgi:hypothetical protein